MAIHLGRSLPNASRDRPERRRGRPARRRKLSQRRLPLLLGLAPGGVYPAAAVAGGAVRSYRTISPLPPAAQGRNGFGGVFLWHFPWGRPRRALPGTVPPWSPDFPPSSHTQGMGEERPSDRLAGMIWDAPPHLSNLGSAWFRAGRARLAASPGTFEGQACSPAFLGRECL
jgi:hypothetical protein